MPVALQVPLDPAGPLAVDAVAGDLAARVQRAGAGRLDRALRGGVRLGERDVDADPPEHAAGDGAGGPERAVLDLDRVGDRHRVGRPAPPGRSQRRPTPPAKRARPEITPPTSAASGGGIGIRIPTFLSAALTTLSKLVLATWPGPAGSIIGIPPGIRRRGGAPGGGRGRRRAGRRASPGRRARRALRLQHAGDRGVAGVRGERADHARREGGAGAAGHARDRGVAVRAGQGTAAARRGRGGGRSRPRAPAGAPERLRAPCASITPEPAAPVNPAGPTCADGLPAGRGTCRTPCATA